MTAKPQIDCERHGETIVIALRGDIDITVRHDLEDALRRAVPDDVLGVVLDLERVTFMDSSAAQMLFGLQQDLEGTRRRMVVALDPDSAVRSALELVDLGELLDLAPDRAAALEELAA